MKYVFRCLLFGFLVVVYHSCCKPYRVYTHMNDEELGWLTNRYVGETMYFQSQDGILDTVKLVEIVIKNSTDTIDREYYYHNIGDGEYYAGGRIQFSLRDIPYFNSFYLYKDSNELIYFGMEMLDIWIPAVHLIDSCIQIDSIVFEEVALFDERTCEVINTHKLPNPITSLAWSKKYGLVQYTFQDGSVFNRIDLKN